MLSLFNTGYGLQDQLDGVKNGIAIVSTGNTHIAITSGQYVYIQDNSTLAEGLYRATANIAANGTLSGSNVTAVSGGGLNALNSNLTQYVAINNSDDMKAKLTSAFTTISGRNLAVDRSYPVMLSLSGANFSGSYTGTFNLTSGGIRFLIGDETHLIEGLFLRANNTISSVTDLRRKLNLNAKEYIFSNTATITIDLEREQTQYYFGQVEIVNSNQSIMSTMNADASHIVNYGIGSVTASVSGTTLTITKSDGVTFWGITHVTLVTNYDLN